jgi:hypothetical protein
MPVALSFAGEIMLNEPLKVDLIMEARASFDHLLARLQALDAKHASSQQHHQHSVPDAANDSLDTSCS